jgi:hypothetical protein
MTGFCRRELPAGEQGDHGARLVKTNLFASDFWACPQLNGRLREIGRENCQV